MNRSGGDRVERFDRWAGSYDESVADASFPLAGYDAVLGAVVRSADVGPNHVVLDVGIGTGNLAERIAPSGCTIWGVDFSAEMLKRARAKLPVAHLVRADLRAGWPHDLPDRFDRILSAYVFHEFPDDEKLRLLEDLAAHLTPGGRIAIGDVSFPDERSREASHRKWSAAWDEDEHYWVADAILPALEARGFAVEYEQISFCGGVFALWRDAA